MFQCKQRLVSPLCLVFPHREIRSVCNFYFLDHDPRPFSPPVSQRKREKSPLSIQESERRQSFKRLRLPRRKSERKIPFHPQLLPSLLIKSCRFPARATSAKSLLRKLILRNGRSSAVSILRVKAETLDLD